MTVSEGRRRLLDELEQIHARFERRAQMAVVEPLIASPLTMQQLKVLAMVVLGEGAATGQEIAVRLGVAPATMSGMIDRLVDRELVERVDNPDDRRVRRLVVTASGRELASRLLAGPDILPEVLLQRLADDDLRALIQGFLAVERAWDELEDAAEVSIKER